MMLLNDILNWNEIPISTFADNMQIATNLSVRCRSDWLILLNAILFNQVLLSWINTDNRGDWAGAEILTTPTDLTTPAVLSRLQWFNSSVSNWIDMEMLLS